MPKNQLYNLSDSPFFKNLGQKTVDKSSCLQANTILLSLLLPNYHAIPASFSDLSLNDLYEKALCLLTDSIQILGINFNQSLFTEEFIKIAESTASDAAAAYRNDPAATSIDEVKLTYPGILATTCYRIAHALYSQGIKIIPRIISEWAHSKTGIDIHPGAKIGSSFFIDHGTGVVIGETTIIGNSVTLYQGVTLGAKNFPLDDKGDPIKGAKRHPTVEDNVIIYANSTILGGDTIIGKNSTIGGNLFITKSIPINSLVLGISGEKENSLKIIEKEKI